MAEHTAKSKRGNSVVKMALIPVLVLGLAAVLLWPDGDSDTLATGPESQPAAPDVAAEVTPEEAARRERAIAVERRRKQVDEMELSVILEHDPFVVSRTLSKELAREQPEDVEAKLAEAARIKRIEEVVKSLETERVNARGGPRPGGSTGYWK